VIRPSRRLLLRLAGVVALSGLPYLMMRIPWARAWGVGFVGFVRTAGPGGALGLLGFLTGWSLIGAPFWIMAGVAGYAYGFPLGLALGLPLVTAAMTLAFLLGRVVVPRVWPASKDVESPDARRIAAVRRAVAADGLKITFLLRMTPFVPQNVLTYVLASTPLRVRDFVAGTAGGLLPITLFYVYAGSLVEDAAALLAGETPDLGAARWIALGSGLLAAAVALFVIGRLARRALARAIDPA
jgi:uncharacterized membrane protein YdjX (TVP38/TMEM64 family)